MNKDALIDFSDLEDFSEFRGIIALKNGMTISKAKNNTLYATLTMLGRGGTKGTGVKFNFGNNKDDTANIVLSKNFSFWEVTLSKNTTEDSLIIRTMRSVNLKKAEMDELFSAIYKKESYTEEELAIFDSQKSLLEMMNFRVDPLQREHLELPCRQFPEYYGCAKLLAALLTGNWAEDSFPEVTPELASYIVLIEAKYFTDFSRDTNNVIAYMVNDLSGIFKKAPEVLNLITKLYFTTPILQI